MEGVFSVAPAVHFAPMPTASVKVACHLGLEDLRISLSLVWRLTRMHLGVVLFLVLGTQCTPCELLLLYYFFGQRLDPYIVSWVFYLIVS